MSTRLVAKVALVVSLGCASGCGDDSGAPVDSAADSGVDSAVVDVGLDTSPTVPGPTASPALPVLTPCPDGWREVPGADGAPTVCEPFGEAGHRTCAATEAHLPGSAGCAPITTPCPADGWPVDIPELDVVYLRADAPPGGDGSLDAPYATLDEAIAAVPDGGAIALAPGSYGPSTIRDRTLALRGACADVVLTATALGRALTISSSTVTVDNLRFANANNGVRAFDSTVSLTRVVFENLGGLGIDVARGSLDGRRLHFHDVEDSALFAGTDANVALHEVSVTGLSHATIRSNDGAVSVHDSVFAVAAGAEEAFTGSQSRGGTFERTVFIGGGGFLAYSGATITLRDSVVVDSPTASGGVGDALGAFEGAGLVLERVRIERARLFGAAAADAGSTLTARDLVVKNPIGTSQSLGHGLELGEGAVGDLARVYIEGAGALGVLATSAGTEVTAEDLTIRGTRPDSLGLYGRALQIQAGAFFTGRRVAALGNHEVAIVAGAEGARIVLSDLLVSDTRVRGCAAMGCAAAGIGVGAYVGASLSITDFRIEGNVLAGVQVANDGEVDLLRGEVRGHPIGVNVQVPGYDVTRLTTEVVFRDNETNLDSDELPVPDATTP